MNNTDILILELDAAEKQARDILTKEGIDPDKIERHLFSGWPETKVYFADIVHLNPKLSDFNETAHYAYRMLGAVMLIREMMQECKDDDELRRMTYLLKLGQFRVLTEVGLNIPEARKYYNKKLSSEGGKNKKGAEGPMKQTVRRIVKKIRADKSKLTFETVIDKMMDSDFMADLFHATKDPIPLNILGIYTSTGISIEVEDENYDERNHFKYRLRTGDDKKVTFRRINDTLQEILKK